MQADETLVNYVATTYYNLTPVLGSIKRLPGYDDRNFLITDSSNHKTYVLKIVNRDESSKELTDIIDEILYNAHLYCESKLEDSASGAHFVVPKIARTTSGKLSTLATVRHKCPSSSQDNQDILEDVKCNIKLSEFFDGPTVFDYINGGRSLLAKRRPSRSSRQHEKLYQKLGVVANQLFLFFRQQQHLSEDLARIRAESSSAWILDTCEQTIRQNLDHLFPNNETDEDEKRGLVARVLDEYVAATKPELAKLPRFVMHSDLSTKNILVNAQETGDVERLKVCIIDFQDLQRGPQAADVAILILYCIIEQEIMPFDRALTLLPRWILAGYQTHSAWSLNADELRLLPSLIKLRLCQSLLNGLVAFERDSENSYVLQTNQRGWTLLSLMSEPESAFSKPDRLVELWRPQAD